MTLKKFVHSHIMTLMKYITLKYPTKVNRYPCFDIIAISETTITKQVSLLNNLNLNNYSFEFTPTETSAGGTLLYIANHLSYKKMNWNLLLLKLSTRKNQIL